MASRKNLYTILTRPEGIDGSPNTIHQERRRSYRLPGLWRRPARYCVDPGVALACRTHLGTALQRAPSEETHRLLPGDCLRQARPGALRPGRRANPRGADYGRSGGDECGRLRARIHLWMVGRWADVADVRRHIPRANPGPGAVRYLCVDEERALVFTPRAIRAITSRRGSSLGRRRLPGFQCAEHATGRSHGPSVFPTRTGIGKPRLHSRPDAGQL